jgi:ribokinase
MATIEYLVQQCARQSVRVILNPAPARHLSDELIEKVFLITPNEREAEFLTGISIREPASIKMAAERLHQKGIANVIITLGKRGAYWSSVNGYGYVEAPSRKAIDTTAAGDCFNGALAVALSENKSLEEATRFACKAASLSVTKVGAQASMPTLQELEDVHT